MPSYSFILVCLSIVKILEKTCKLIYLQFHCTLFCHIECSILSFYCYVECNLFWSNALGKLHIWRQNWIIVGVKVQFAPSITEYPCFKNLSCLLQCQSSMVTIYCDVSNLQWTDTLHSASMVSHGSSLLSIMDQEYLWRIENMDKI